MDRYDRRILVLLQKDGRLTNLELADQIGLSPSPCLRRVRALEESGIIHGYHALLDAQKQLAQLPFTVYSAPKRRRYLPLDFRLMLEANHGSHSQECPPGRRRA